MELKYKILIYAGVMAIGIIILSILFIRDWRKYRRNADE